MENPFHKDYDENELIKSFHSQGGFLLFIESYFNKEYQYHIKQGFSWKLHSLPLKNICMSPLEDDIQKYKYKYEFEFFNGFTSGIKLIQAIHSPIVSFQSMDEFMKEQEILIIFQRIRFQLRRLVYHYRNYRKHLYPVYNTEDLYGEEFKIIPVKSRRHTSSQNQQNNYGKNVLKLWDDSLKRWNLFTMNDLLGIFREKVIQYGVRPRNPYTNLEFTEKQSIVIHQWLLERIHHLSITTPQDIILIHYLKYPSLILYHYWISLIFTRHSISINYTLFRTSFLSVIPTPVIIMNPFMIYFLKNHLRVSHYRLPESDELLTQEMEILETYLKLVMVLKSQVIHRRRNRRLRNHENELEDDDGALDIIPLYGLIPTKKMEYFLYELYLKDNTLQVVNEWIQNWYRINSLVLKRYQTSSFLRKYSPTTLSVWSEEFQSLCIRQSLSANPQETSTMNPSKKRRNYELESSNESSNESPNE
jgi:hypothetical protein